MDKEFPRRQVVIDHVPKNNDFLNTKDPQEVMDENYNRYELGISPEHAERASSGGLETEEDFKLDDRESDDRELVRDELGEEAEQNKPVIPSAIRPEPPEPVD